MKARGEGGGEEKEVVLEVERDTIAFTGGVVLFVLYGDREKKYVSF